MMRRSCYHDRNNAEEGLSSLLEYLSVSGVLVVLLLIIMFAVNAALIQGPSDTLKYHQFTDIGNGVSVRIVDLYVIAPGNGTITTKFDLPEDVASQDYWVQLEPGKTGAAQRIMVTDYHITSTIALGGIGATRPVTGETHGKGLNRISYDSGGYT
jgi:hypothetical protein